MFHSDLGLFFQKKKCFLCRFTCTSHPNIQHKVPIFWYIQNVSLWPITLFANNVFVPLPIHPSWRYWHLKLVGPLILIYKARSPHSDICKMFRSDIGRFCKKTKIVPLHNSLGWWFYHWISESPLNLIYRRRSPYSNICRVWLLHGFSKGKQGHCVQLTIEDVTLVLLSWQNTVFHHMIYFCS